MKDMLIYLKTNHIYNDPINCVIDLIIEDKIDFNAINEKLRALGYTLYDIKNESLELVIDAIDYILEDDIITQQELENVVTLKQILRIKEGEFLKYSKEHVIQDVIYHQMQIILYDLRVDVEESLKKTYLQKLFDLSYDQFLKFERPAIEEALERGARLEDLDTFYK